MADLNRPAAVTSEARALYIGSGAFIILGAAAFLLVGREPVPLSGRGSAGEIAALGTAVLGGVAVVAGSLQRRPAVAPQVRRDGRIRNAIDIAALALAHACTFLVGWLALFAIFQQAFIGAVLYPVAAAILVGTTGAISAYIAYLSALSMTAYRLAALLAVFLVTGILASMLTAQDPLWWQEHLSALGASSDISGVAFNVTLIVAGVVITTLAGYSTSTLRATADTKPALHRVRWLEGDIVLLGVFLAGVGLFPVDERFWIHTLFASGMAIVFGMLVFRIRKLVPSISATFGLLGWVFLAVIAAAAVLWFPVGYYNLTAVELIAASLIFSWLIVLIRNLAAVDADQYDAALYDAEQQDAVLYDADQEGVERYDAEQQDADRYDAEQQDADRYDAEPQDAGTYEAAQQDADRYEAAQQDTALYDAYRQDADPYGGEQNGPAQNDTAQKDTSLYDAYRQHADQQDADLLARPRPQPGDSTAPSAATATDMKADKTASEP
jgi:hypothetical membrane protein